jgi:hypothetical protein
MLKLNNFLSTSGTGLWSNEATRVFVNRVSLAYLNDIKSFGELRVHFDESTWDTGIDGLIYTDPLFLQQLKEVLVSKGYSTEACEDIQYSEQGMQGANFVSFDVTSKFISAWLSKSEAV